MKQNRQQLEHLETETKINKNNCPLCNDTGMVFYMKNGYEFAKDCPNGCQQKNIRNRKLQFADIPKEFNQLTVESFDTSLYSSDETREKAELVKTVCSNYIANFNEIQEEGKGLYLYSKVKGSGKTRMAVSIANDIINKFMVSAKFTTAIRILEEIKYTWNSSEYSEKQLINEIIRVPVLVIDDIGVERSTAWVDEKFYSIIDSRLISKKITIFTSNVRIEDLTLDERIKSRISKMALPLQFPNESVRDALARKENSEFLLKLIG